MKNVSSGCSRQILSCVRTSELLVGDICLSSSGKGPCVTMGKRGAVLKANVCASSAHLCMFPVFVCLTAPDSCGEFEFSPPIEHTRAPLLQIPCCDFSSSYLNRSLFLLAFLCNVSILSVPSLHVLNSTPFLFQSCCMRRWPSFRRRSTCSGR